MLAEADGILYGDSERREVVLARGPLDFIPSKIDGLLKVEDKKLLLEDAQRIYDAAEDKAQADGSENVGGRSDWELRILASSLTELAVEDEPVMSAAEIIDTLYEAATALDALSRHVSETEHLSDDDPYLLRLIASRLESSTPEKAEEQSRPLIIQRHSR